jgi:Mediator complex subunit MED14
MERKIGEWERGKLKGIINSTTFFNSLEIYNFAARTRQLFIRLLALVKWANSASKVDKSTVR